MYTKDAVAVPEERININIISEFIYKFLTKNCLDYNTQINFWQNKLINCNKNRKGSRFLQKKNPKKSVLIVDKLFS